jgi:hypothetical protein
MCAGLGGCGGNVTIFGTTSINSITNYSNGLGCTPQLAPPINVNWSESFEAANINEANFPSWQGAETSLLADNEPNGAFSLNLDAANANPWAQDYVRSNFFNMAGQSLKAITFFSQHKGVEVGENLQVKYRNDQGQWIIAMTVPSDGSNQSSFQFQSFDLPADAYHDGFRIELKALVNEPNDDWYVDQLSIGDGCAPPVTYCAVSPNSFGPGAVMTYSGSTYIAQNNLSLFAAGCATNQFGLFFHGPNQTQVTFGNGFRCVSGAIVRLPLLQTNSFGEVGMNFDVTSSGISAGSSANFQFWFRDPMGGGSAFNLSNALNTQWCP